VNEAYQLGANSFLVKPFDFEDFTHLSRLIADFWFKASQVPESFRPPREAENDAKRRKDQEDTNL
jgi:hypothetical protein